MRLIGFPGGLKLEAQGIVYVSERTENSFRKPKAASLVDSSNSRVLKLSPTGEPTGVIGQYGVQLGHFR